METVGKRWLGDEVIRVKVRARVYLGEVGDGDGGEEVVLDLEAEPAAVQQLPEGRVEVARRLHLVRGRVRGWGFGGGG